MAKENGPCFNCGYFWADMDENGFVMSHEYCHYSDPWPAPCEYDDEPEEPEYEDWEERW